MQSQLRVLIVDDDAETRDGLGMFFSSDGYDCELAADAAAALQVVEQKEVDAVLCDVRMEGMNGLELLDRLGRTHPSLPFVVMTAMGGIADAVDAMKRGAFQYVTKPYDLGKLRAIIRSAIEDRRLQGGAPSERRQVAPSLAANGAAPASTLAELVGDGAAMRALRATIELVAASSAPVLVTGETGAGKELVARAIHARGARRNRPFVAVNTSAIPAELLEGEMFGHVRGAFTGAAQARRGLLTEADGGTLLLDEIGDMSMDLQARILRVLQFGDVRPVGSDRTHNVNVRIIAATHRALPALVREGRFREDLYFRLYVLPIVVPPLREHPEDIPALAAHFLADARQRTPHSPVRSISPEALRALTDAPWPGNVRELASVIERAVVFGADAQIEATALSSLPDSSPGLPWSFPSHEPWTLRRLNRAYAQWVLTQTGGNKERAAALLGIDLSTLYRWNRARRN